MKADNFDSLNEAALKKAQFLWEEYKYRHDLIWQRLFVLTSVVTIITTIPFVNMERYKTELIGKWIPITPWIALILVIFMLLVMHNELELFNKIKVAYRGQQNMLLGNEMKYDLSKKSRFELYVKCYMIFMAALCAVSGLIAWH